MNRCVGKETRPHSAAGSSAGRGVRTHTHNADNAEQMEPPQNPPTTNQRDEKGDLTTRGVLEPPRTLNVDTSRPRWFRKRILSNVYGRMNTTFHTTSPGEPTRGERRPAPVMKLVLPWYQEQRKTAHSPQKGNHLKNADTEVPNNM